MNIVLKKINNFPNWFYMIFFSFLVCWCCILETDILTGTKFLSKPGVDHQKSKTKITPFFTSQLDELYTFLLAARELPKYLYYSANSLLEYKEKLKLKNTCC